MKIDINKPCMQKNGIAKNFTHNPTGLTRPRILFSAINGGSGKTFITTGIIAALTARGLNVQAFKKGPDYIDSKWHTLAGKRKCYNLDLYLFKDHALSSLTERSFDADISIIEGNHGLYDSVDSEGTGSTAFLARHTKTPVILIVNCQKMSRSVAAIINGFVNFEKDTNIVGVILNQVSGKRHEEKIRESIAAHCRVEIFGVVYKTNEAALEQRHLGIITTEDKPEAQSVVNALQNIAERSINLDKILEAASLAGPLPECISTTRNVYSKAPDKEKNSNKIVIAVARDAAFNFYYPDNLEALEQEGTKLVYFSPIGDETLPQCDGVYLGGGYPELYARELGKNLGMKKSIAEQVENGLPVFAECGGMMYLTEKIVWDKNEHEMTGIIKAQSVMHKKPQGKGYAELEVLPAENPKATEEAAGIVKKFSLWKIADGLITRTHEFHYSILQNLPETTNFIFKVNRGTGIKNKHDGIMYKNLFATYSHFHSLAAPWWAPAFVNACKMHKNNNT